MDDEAVSLQQLQVIQERMNQVMRELCPDEYSNIDVTEQLVPMIPLSTLILEKQATSAQIQEFITLE